MIKLNGFHNVSSGCVCFVVYTKFSFVHTYNTLILDYYRTLVFFYWEIIFIPVYNIIVNNFLYVESQANWPKAL